MNKNIIFALFGLLAFSSLWSQTPEIMKINVQREAVTKDPLALKMEFQPDARFTNGFFLELPEGLKTVVKSVSRNGEGMWLLNNDQPVEQKNVIGWYNSDDGIMFHYNLDDLTSPLEIELVPDTKKLKRFDTFEVKVNPVVREADKFVAQTDVATRTTVTVKQNIQRNEQ